MRHCARSSGSSPLGGGCHSPGRVAKQRGDRCREHPRPRTSQASVYGACRPGNRAHPLGEVEEGCRQASQALTLAIELRYAVSVDRMRGLDQHLAPWHDSRPSRPSRTSSRSSWCWPSRPHPSLDW
jgi:hypothetical protein